MNRELLVVSVQEGCTWNRLPICQLCHAGSSSRNQEAKKPSKKQTTSSQVATSPADDPVVGRIQEAFGSLVPRTGTKSQVGALGFHRGLIRVRRIS